MDLIEFKKVWKFPKDTRFERDVFEVLGNVSLDGWDFEITPENFIEIVREDCLRKFIITISQHNVSYRAIYFPETVSTMYGSGPLSSEYLERVIRRSRNIGFFLGSFDPIHNGHVAVVNKALKSLDEVIIVPAPQNPWKSQKSIDLLDRVELCALAAGEDERIRILCGAREYFNIDHMMDNDGNVYSWKQLESILEDEDDELRCSGLFILCGTDTANSIYKWKNYDWIKSRFRLLEYDRPGISERVDKELVEISSTVIRGMIKKKEWKSLENYLPYQVLTRIKERKLYE